MTEAQIREIAKGVADGLAPHFREIHERLDSLDEGLAEVRTDIANLRAELVGVIDERFPIVTSSPTR